MTAFINATLFTGDAAVQNKALLIEKNKITGIINTDAIPSGAAIVDCTGKYIAPGLIDLQIYGAGGYLFSNKPSAEALHAITDAILKTGTTAFMLTLATNSMEVFREAITIVKENPQPALLGLHLEGPYINPIKRGAHIEAYIKVPTVKEIEALLEG